MPSLVTINDGCMHGGRAGIALLAQANSPVAPGKPFYWVLVPSVHPNVPYWYGEDCLTVTEGTLPAVPEKGSSARHHIEKGGNVATFEIDHATKVSLLAAGFAVTFIPS